MKDYLKVSYDFESEDLVGTYDELPLWAAPVGLKLLEKVDYSKLNIKGLDVGCGAGFPLLELAQRLGESSTMVGLDVWKAALKRIEQKAEIYGVRNIQCINGDAKAIPFPDASFDLIVSNNGINNTGDELQTIGECFRVCKPGGQFIFTVNLPETMIEFYNIFRSVLAQAGLADRLEALNEHIYKHRKPVERYEEWIYQVGFEIRDIDVDRFMMRFVDGTAMLNYHFIKMCFLEPWKSVVPVEKTEAVFECLEEQLNEYARANRGLFLSIPYVCMVCEKK